MQNADTALLVRAYSERFRTLLTVVEGTHKDLLESGKNHRGHGPDHDDMVAGYCLAIVGKDDTLARQCFVTAKLHSLDRCWGEDVAEKMVRRFLFLTESEFSPSERDGILLAVLNHSEPNQIGDSELLTVFKDADRLANLGPAVIVRCGQFRPDKPVADARYLDIDVKDPKTTFKDAMTCLDDLKACLEWEDIVKYPKFGLRTVRGQELGKPYFDFLRSFFELNKRQYQEAGLVS